jgi:hypothetical protein
MDLEAPGNFPHAPEMIRTPPANPGILMERRSTIHTDSGRSQDSFVPPQLPPNPQPENFPELGIPAQRIPAPDPTLTAILARLTDVIGNQFRQNSAHPEIPDTKGPTVRAPDRFNGSDRSKLKPFLLQCRMVFLGHPSRFRSESSKVIYAASYLEGTAAAWFAPFVEGDPHIPVLSDFTLFEEELRSLFGDPDEAATNERKLRNLRMKDHQTVAGYITLFRQYSAHVPWGNSALLSQFRQGLPDRILDLIAQRENPVTTLHQMMDVCLRMDNRYHERQAEKKADNRKNISSDSDREKSRTVRQATYK